MRHSKAAMQARHLHVAHFTVMDAPRRVETHSGPDKAKVYSTVRYSAPAAPASPFADMLKGFAAEVRSHEAESEEPRCFLSGRWGFG